MLDWLTDHKLPLGAWLRAGVDGLTTHGRGVFDTVSLVLGGLTTELELVPATPCVAEFAHHINRSTSCGALG